MEAAEIEIGGGGWHQVNAVPIGVEPGTKAYQKDVADGHLTAFVSPPYGKNGWHISISHRTRTLSPTTGKPMPGRLVTWDELKEARYRFTPNKVTMALILPPKEEYVNIHPTTMHLWEIPAEYK